MAENITNYQQYVKVVMLKGEKGDTYDDTELRNELNTILANNAYVVAIEDGTFELPIHTINDTTTGTSSTWSSSKITDEISAIIDDSQEAETSETTTMSANKLSGIISQLNQNIDGIYNDVVTLNTQKWRYIGTLNTTYTRSLRIDFTEAETSTIIILTVNNVNADGNNVFVSRKTMITPELSGVPAWQIAGANMNQDEIMILGSYNDGNPFISVTNNTPTGSGIGCAVYAMYLN